MIKLGFIGAGKVGTALAIRLHRKGYPVVAVHDTKPEAARHFVGAIEGCKTAGRTQEVADAADLVFITVVDDLIARTASGIKWRQEQMAVHCSGANSAALLDGAKEQGAIVGVFHPGQMFADKEQAVEAISGSTFDIEADEPLLGIFKELAAALDGYWIEVNAEQRAAYHVAIELPSVYLMLNYRLAVKVFQAMGISAEEATRVLLALIHATTRNIETFGTSKALTGPVDRGDTETVKRHIDGLQSVYPPVLPLYRELASQNIPFALEHESIDREKALELEDILRKYRINPTQ
jgi:predicted short-subunit dehydrogenase-like oxidoreductase (DUF2520 family)